MYKKTVLLILVTYLLPMTCLASGYTDNYNGTVSDENTGLMWQQDGENIVQTWPESLDYCNELNLANYNDWRLPNVKEIISIIDGMVKDPAINTDYFINTQPFYWTSTTVTENPSRAWYASFSFSGGIASGDISYGSDKYSPFYLGSIYARCVRSDDYSLNNEVPPAECDSNNLDLCATRSTCTGARGYWWNNNSCNGTPEPAVCDSNNLDLCTSSYTCSDAGGYWWSDNTCNSNEEPSQLPDGFVSQGGLTWMPVSSEYYTYAQATNLCAGYINGEWGWHLPTQAELSDLYSEYSKESGVFMAYGLYEIGWTLGYTWTSTSTKVGMHEVVRLMFGTVGSEWDLAIEGHYVTCVK